MLSKEITIFDNPNPPPPFPPQKDKLIKCVHKYFYQHHWIESCTVMLNVSGAKLIPENDVILTIKKINQRNFF